MTTKIYYKNRGKRIFKDIIEPLVLSLLAYALIIILILWVSRNIVPRLMLLGAGVLVVVWAIERWRKEESEKK